MGDRYLPGAVVRVQVKNFLTYDFAEFFPGPYLNMIIVRPALLYSTPSSLKLALLTTFCSCRDPTDRASQPSYAPLPSVWVGRRRSVDDRCSPSSRLYQLTSAAQSSCAAKVLGRADDLSQFLKYGATSAHVEIELKGLGGQANTTVKRMIGKDSNKSKMELNGSSPSALLSLCTDA